jgi:hypothetical protein
MASEGARVFLSGRHLPPVEAVFNVDILTARAVARHMVSRHWQSLEQGHVLQEVAELNF